MNDKKILVSVVIPTYSRSDALKRAIESVLKQTYQNIEVIVVDDNPPGSNWRASSQEVMEKYQNLPQIYYIQNSENLGGARTRNVGIEAARGEYIAFLDDDDEYKPEKIEKQLSVFLNNENPKLALVYCYAIFQDEHGKSSYSDRRNYHGNCLYEAMESNCIAATSQWMVKKKAIQNVGGFPFVPCKQDSQLILKLLSAGYEVEVLKEELSIYNNYVIGDRISQGSKKNILGEIAYLRECRRQYFKLKDWQILNVEYAFAEKLLALYLNNQMIEEAKHEWQIMKKLNYKRACVWWVKYVWHNYIKDKFRWGKAENGRRI